MLPQDSLASGMHDAGGGADLGVVIGVDVVHQEIDQTALFLEHREEADDFGIGAGGGGRRWGGPSGFGLRLRRGRFLARWQQQAYQDEDRQRQGGIR